MNLYQAAETGDLERVRELVEQGADKEETCKKETCKDRTPLFIASRNGHLAVVRYLVEQEADVERVNNSNGWTPLITSSYSCRTEVVRYLLEQGANRDKAANDGMTSLHLAALKGNIEIAKLLMLYGADLNARTNAGRLPIDFAANDEIEQAIRDEPRRRMDAAPGKRATEQDHHPNAAESASILQAEGEAEEVNQCNKRPRLNEGTEAEEDEDSEPSDGEDD